MEPWPNHQAKVGGGERRRHSGHGGKGLLWDELLQCNLEGDELQPVDLGPGEGPAIRQVTLTQQHAFIAGVNVVNI